MHPKKKNKMLNQIKMKEKLVSFIVILTVSSAFEMLQCEIWLWSQFWVMPCGSYWGFHEPFVWGSNWLTMLLWGRRGQKAQHWCLRGKRHCAPVSGHFYLEWQITSSKSGRRSSFSEALAINSESSDLWWTLTMGKEKRRLNQCMTKTCSVCIAYGVLLLKRLKTCLMVTMYKTELTANHIIWV